MLELSDYAVVTEYGFCVRKASGRRYDKLLVSGLGRSGTSSIASLLKYLGYYVGAIDKVVTNEDKSLQKLLGANQHEQIREELARRQQDHPLLAWKDPKLLSESGVRLMATLPDDWALVLTSRDALSISMRLSRQHGSNVLTNFETVLERQARMVAAMRNIQPKAVFVVSYEKLMANPETTIMGLLIDINPALLESVDIAQVWNSAQRDQEKYVNHADVSRNR